MWICICTPKSLEEYVPKILILAIYDWWERGWDGFVIQRVPKTLISFWQDTSLHPMVWLPMTVYLPNIVPHFLGNSLGPSSRHVTLAELNQSPFLRLIHETRYSSPAGFIWKAGSASHYVFFQAERSLCGGREANVQRNRDKKRCKKAHPMSTVSPVLGSKTLVHVWFL